MNREHGGADAQGLARYDFSSNANACGPCPEAWQAVRQADAAHYPDPAYTQLRQILARWHQVEAWRIVLAGSASEFIRRMTWACHLHGARQYWVPRHAYGDYALAAQACGMRRVADSRAADLLWLCDPSSPLGVSQEPVPWPADLQRLDAAVVLDLAYAPLRLDGQPVVFDPALSVAWRLYSPNKALGLTGVRGAYAIAPQHAQAQAAVLESLSASWPLGAHAHAMLLAWAQPAVQQWVRDSLQTLRIWKHSLTEALQAMGWNCLPSLTHYFCALPPCRLSARGLRRHGIKLRDAQSFGLPGHWRLSAQPPHSQAALLHALRHHHDVYDVEQGGEA
jgi:histidinol-phosphate aminotransferase